MGSRLEANSSAVRKRIEKHKFENEEGEEYEPSKFGGFTDYFRRKKIKLQNRDAEIRSSADQPRIFRGVVAHVNGYTQPSLSDLHDLIVRYGGGFMQYLDGKTTVTHIIASNLTPKKKVEFSKYRIVKPAWVVDSIEAGRLLPWDAYRVVDEGIGQRVLGFENGNVTSQVNGVYGGYRDQTETSWYTKQVKDVADQLNSRGPSVPFFSTQLPPDDEIESDPRVSPAIGEDSIGQADQKPGSAIDEQISHDKGGLSELHGDLDAELVPAADQSFTESFPNTQEHSSRQPFERVPKDAMVLSFDPLERSDLFKNPDIGSTAHPLDAQRLSQQPAVPMPAAKNSNGRPSEHSPDESEQHSPTSATAQDPLRLAMCGDGSSVTKDDATSNAEMSAEEHNALLLADPKVWKSTVVNPGFLKQYYEESRLHHLSTWKAALKTQLQALAAEKSSSQKAREKRTPGARRYILHVDFDSFFAAVSLKKHPQYIEKPVVVAHGNGAGAEIASCNYPARKFGIKNGMWMKHAQKMCPDLKVLPYDFKAYEDASRIFYEAIIDTGGVVQSVSVDEALVDISAQCITAGGHDGKGIHEGSIWREQAKADSIAKGLRDRIKHETGCAVSVGVGGNILLAKVALRRAKPAGQHHIKPEEALDFLGELTMQDLPGIAYSIGGKLEEIGVKYVKDVRQLSKERMISVLGPKTGEKVWDYSRGIDRAAVGDQVVRKSVSAEVNWGIRFVTQEQADEFIQSLCDELHKRLLGEGVKGRQLTMKIMRRAADAPLDPPKHLGHGKCDTFNKSLVLGVATNDRIVLGREALSILKGFGFPPGELRGLGVQMTKLEPMKGSADSPIDSSQRRLQFKTPSATKSRLPLDDTIEDDIESPHKPKAPPAPHPAAAFATEASPSGKARTPLNTLGTQFILPTQVDPEVLAELPSDIRSKLLAKQAPPARNQDRSKSPETRPRSNTPALPADAIPSESQLDPETLSALPDDVRAEILSFYTNPPPKPPHNQALLPQSPRKARTTKLPKKLPTPTKKRTRLFPHSKSTTSTLTQSNFIAPSKANPSAPPSEDITDSISADFLSALPPDIRAEVLAQSRHARLQKRGGIDISSSSHRKRKPPPAALAQGQRTLTLPPLSPIPTFTARKLSSLPELREAIRAWFEEFRDEGPYVEDVEALVGYVRRVVREEGDMGKAVGVGRWVGWVVGEGFGGLGKEGEGGGGGDRRREAWERAVGRVEAGVQEAVTARGLGAVEF